MLYKLHSFDALLRVKAGRVAARVCIFLAEGRGLFDVVVGRAVELFLEDWLLIDCLELGLEVVQCLGAAVGSTSMVGKVVPGVVGFVRKGAPAQVST